MAELAKRVRLIDVAQQAGVSVTTASDALADSPRVKIETREMVQRVAKALRYQPNRAARDLVMQTASSVSVIFSGPESMNFLSNPFFIQLFRPVVESLSSEGVPVITEITTEKNEVKTLENHAFGSSSAAIILIGTRMPDDELEELSRKLPVPIVTVVRHPLRGSSFGVEVDNKEIGSIAAAHLLDLGHKRIAYIGASTGVGLSEERLSGFKSEISRRGFTLMPEDIFPGDFYQESGRLAMLEIIETGKATAVFAANDLMALGALEACKQRGVDVPKQMSILGCDDIPNLHLLSVPLSSIALPIREIGVLAAKQAQGVVETKEPTGPKKLHANLVARESTAAIHFE